MGGKQRLAYSPLGVVVSASSEYLWKTLNYWSPQCLTAPSHSERELSVITIIDAGRTTSYALNFGVTESNLTKFLPNVQNSLLINLLQLKFRCSNSFRNGSMPNEGRSSNCGRVAAKIRQTPFLNSDVTAQMFTKFLRDVAQSSPCYLCKAA